MSFITDIKTFAALGSGVIGSGWVSRALAHGLDVVAWDPAPGAEAALRKRVANAWGALEKNKAWHPALRKIGCALSQPSKNACATPTSFRKAPPSAWS
nr:hypothetical protein GCM10020185_39810 [Pseudomonas brassicacearum subsp. brassicacearum]